MGFVVCRSFVGDGYWKIAPEIACKMQINESILNYDAKFRLLQLNPSNAGSVPMLIIPSSGLDVQYYSNNNMARFLQPSKGSLYSKKPSRQQQRVKSGRRGLL